MPDGYPRTYEEWMNLWYDWSLEDKNATAIMRKAGFRPGAGGVLSPVPILSVEGSRIAEASCSVELQALIDDFHADPSDETRDALTAYIEGLLGETIEDAFPSEWTAALSGQGEQVVTFTSDTDVIRLTFNRYPTGFSSGGSYEVEIPGNYSFDITSDDIHASSALTAWTTGMNLSGDEYIQAITQTPSYAIHLGKNQSVRANASAFDAEGGGRTITDQGDALQWDKGPRRTVEIDQPILHVPSSPTSGDPVRIEFGGWSGASPQHGRYVVFWKAGAGLGGPQLFSAVGPPVFFGFLKRNDTSLAAHPLDEWWLNTSTANPAFGDQAVFYTSSGVNAYLSTSIYSGINVDSPDEDIDAAFEDFEDNIYNNPTTGRNLGNQDSRVQAIQQNLSASPGWVSFFWFHPLPAWAWTMPNVGDTVIDVGASHVAPTSAANHPWNSQASRRFMNDLRNYTVATGDTTYQGAIDPTSGVLADYLNVIPRPPNQQTPYLMQRGEWVRSEPGGSSVPTYDVHLIDASCVRTTADPPWPGP